MEMRQKEGVESMTREEAIVILKDEAEYKKYYPYDRQALDMAIQALSQEPTVTSTDEPMTMVYPTIFCEDVISREAVLDGLKGCICEEWVKTLFATMVKQLPPVTQKSGKWENLYRCWMCSECGKQTYIEHKYCPNCGARMESEDKTE